MVKGISRIENTIKALKKARTGFIKSLSAARNDDQRTASSALITLADLTIDELETALKEIKE